MQGCNLFAYADEDPIALGDFTGKGAKDIFSWFEFFKNFGEDVGKNGLSGEGLFKVTVKTAYGQVEYVVHAWAMKEVKQIIAETLEAMKDAEVGGGEAEAVIAMDGAYSCLLVLAIDAIDVVGADPAIDYVSGQLFGGNGSG